MITPEAAALCDRSWKGTSSRNDCSASHQFQGILCPLHLPQTWQKIMKQPVTSVSTHPPYRQVTWSFGKKMDSETWRTFSYDNMGNLTVRKKIHGEEKLLGNCFQISTSKCPLAVKNPVCSSLDSQESSGLLCQLPSFTQTQTHSSWLHFLYQTLASHCVITRRIFPRSQYNLLMYQVIVFWCSSARCARTAQIEMNNFWTG